MSIYTTLQVDRDTALLALARRKWSHLTDEQLGDKLDKHVEANLYNVLVVNNYDDHEQDKTVLLSIVD